MKSKAKYPLDSADRKELKRRFTYHPPKDDQLERYEKLRSNVAFLAAYIRSETPPSREQSLALTKLDEAVMWANAAIARNEKNED